jgi:flagellar hook protein FlgE
MRCLFSGVSGLRAHQQKMDVIGNNIANVNTVGFKSSRVTFSDIFNQTLSGATAPDSTTGRGGINPMQVGLGVGVSSIDTITTRGSTETTGSQTDLAIDGNGLFIVRQGNSGSYLFTRAGNFTLDKSGNLVTSDGLNVYGWMDYGQEQQADGSYVFDTDKDVEPLNLFSDAYNKNKKVLAAKETGNAVFAGSLDSGEDAVGAALNDIADTTDLESQYSTTMTVYDALGNTYEVEVSFTKCYVDSTTDADNPVTSWYWEIQDDSGAGSTGGYIKFDSEGNIITDDSDYSITPEVEFSPDSSGASPFTVSIDFSNLTMTNDDSSVEASSVDGYASGTLEDFSIGADGIIMGVYSNGKQQPLGMVALAKFDNPAGLSKLGSNNYVATANSGDFVNGVMAGDDGSGMLSAGSLEMSNVDLSYEFSQMIITQRGYQANSRIITTADEMLQELVNLKR